jgi:hypothetical protein
MRTACQAAHGPCRPLPGLHTMQTHCTLTLELSTGAEHMEWAQTNTSCSQINNKLRQRLTVRLQDVNKYYICVLLWLSFITIWQYPTQVQKHRVINIKSSIFEVFTQNAVTHMTCSWETWDMQFPSVSNIMYNASFEINGYLVLVIPVRRGIILAKAFSYLEKYSK